MLEPNRGRWLNLVAVATWLACSAAPLAEIILGRFGSPRRSALFVVGFAVYGLGLSLCIRKARSGSAEHSTRVRVALLAVQSVAGMLMLALSRNLATAATLVIVAAELPYIVRRHGRVWLWIAIQTAAMGAVFFTDWRRSADAVLGAITLGGFQAFAVASSLLALSERDARERLARSNAELHATRALLAEGSRADERLRISRDLHDTLGHRLTALSLQLDVATRVPDARRAEHVRQAHAIARLLLADVRDVVGGLRGTSGIDLARAARELARDQTKLAVHIEAPSALVVADPRRAETLLRAVQEIVTNAVRHAHATNLWVRLETVSGGIGLHARDDGRGAASLTLGNGLTGMRERFDECGGHVEFTSSPGGGFEVRGFVPILVDA